MLGKMMKYDLMFGAKKYAFMAALTAALLLIAVATSRLESQLIMGLAIFFAVIATIIYSVMYVVISVRHLSTQLCSNESYLNYNLPASPHTLVLSKLICIFLWGIVTLLLITFFWAVGIGGIALANSEMSLREAWGEMVNAMRMIGMNDNDVRSIISMISWTGLTTSLMSLSLLGFCVSLCNVPFLKERGIGVVTGVVGFFAIQFGISYAIGEIGTFIANRFFDTAALDISYAIRASTTYLSIAYMVAAIGFYFLTVYTVDKHRFIG